MMNSVITGESVLNLNISLPQMDAMVVCDDMNSVECVNPRLFHYGKENFRLVLESKNDDPEVSSTNTEFQENDHIQIISCDTGRYLRAHSCSKYLSWARESDKKTIFAIHLESTTTTLTASDNNYPHSTHANSLCMGGLFTLESVHWPNYKVAITHHPPLLTFDEPQTLGYWCLRKVKHNYNNQQHSGLFPLKIQALDAALRVPVQQQPVRLNRSFTMMALPSRRFPYSNQRTMVYGTPAVQMSEQDGLESCPYCNVSLDPVELVRHVETFHNSGLRQTTLITNSASTQGPFCTRCGQRKNNGNCLRCGIV